MTVYSLHISVVPFRENKCFLIKIFFNLMSFLCKYRNGTEDMCLLLGLLLLWLDLKTNTIT